MAVHIQEVADGKIVIITLSDRLKKEDYAHFVPEVKRLVRKHNKIRMIIEMKDFHGWSMGALWEDMKFDLKHFDHIERLAFVGEKKWESGMALFCRIFTIAKIRYFDMAQLEDAEAWAMEGIPVHQPVG